MINRKMALNSLKSLQYDISAKCMGEAGEEGWAEVQSVIEAIENNKSDEQIMEAAESVGLKYLVNDDWEPDAPEEL